MAVPQFLTTILALDLFRKMYRLLNLHPITLCLFCIIYAACGIGVQFGVCPSLIDTQVPDCESFMATQFGV